MIKHDKFTATFLCIFAAAVMGCSSEPTCDYADAPYINAKELPVLQVPEGLTAPDHTNALTIPPPNERLQKPTEGKKSRCLDRPPSYFGNAEAKKDADKSVDKSGEKNSETSK
jgi:uncharacterized lipoprotein